MLCAQLFATHPVPMEEHARHLMDVFVDRDGQDLHAHKVICHVVEALATVAVLVWEVY